MPNRSEDILQRLKRLRIPEAQNAKSLPLQKCASVGVVLQGFAVLTTIQLDSDLRPQAGKIDGVRSDRHLSAKTSTFELTTPQTPPEKALGIGKLASLCDRKFACLRIGTSNHLQLLSSPYTRQYVTPLRFIPACETKKLSFALAPIPPRFARGTSPCRGKN